jgi:hypothetical protein
MLFSFIFETHQLLLDYKAFFNQNCLILKIIETYFFLHKNLNENKLNFTFKRK